MVSRHRTASNRAHMPTGTSGILSARSVDASHKRLAALLQPGISVLDVGCGNGAITAGIAHKVGPGGRVVGVDVNPRLIDEARQTHRSVPGLAFHVGDAYDLRYEAVFDITTAARVLQWLAAPGDVLYQMIRATVRGGQVIVLDYNHNKLRWHPTPPQEVGTFYESFLHWRASAGMDNAIADKMASMFHDAGLRHVTVTAQHEEVHKGDVAFAQSIDIWAAVIASRGRQMVADGYITENDRAAAEAAYRQWAQTTAQSQSMYLLAAEGIK